MGDYRVVCGQTRCAGKAREGGVAAVLAAQMACAGKARKGGAAAVVAARAARVASSQSGAKVGGAEVCLERGRAEAFSAN